MSAIALAATSKRTKDTARRMMGTSNDLVHIHERDRIDYRYCYRRSSWSSTSPGFFTFFHFVLLPSLSDIHFRLRYQRFCIWFLVPIVLEISLRLSTTVFTSRTARWRSLTGRPLGSFEDGESFFHSSIVTVFLKSLLENSLDH